VNATSSIRFLLAWAEHSAHDAHIFRCIVDNWNAYRKSGPFLSAKGTPVWFNRPGPKDKRLPLMDFISVGARAVMDGHEERNLIVDHSVPLKVLRAGILICAREYDAFESYLLAHYKLGILTKDEDRKLVVAKLDRAMPAEWDGVNAFARYETAGVERSYA
jgi:hypothetical protein